MRVLWITNIIMPTLAKAKGMDITAVGGWMYSSLKRLKDSAPINIAVATVYNGNKFDITEIDDIIYYLLPMHGRSSFKYNPKLEHYWVQVQNNFQPDVVHIHGSEYSHGLAYVNACGTQGVVVSIQGLVSVCSRYYTAGINYKNIKNNVTFRDFVKHDGILKGKESFGKRGRYEIELLQKVHHIIGRTDWDKAHTWAINPNAEYHYCGETLRDSFYHHKWSYDACEPHTMFVSQASYPIKGLHILLKAMPLVLKKYPDAKIYVAGGDPTSAPWWRISGYGKYLKQRIADLRLKDKVIFTGMINEEQMCQRYLKSNVFVCCSAIENSPNSLGEAQLLGMPYVASFVGGVPEIANWNPDVLYRFEEYEMLAVKICNFFSQEHNFIPLDFDASRYDGLRNTSNLISIYNKIAAH